MIGIGHKLQKQTKIKILVEKAKQFNQNYDSLLHQGLDPQQALKTLNQEQFQQRHKLIPHYFQNAKNSTKINDIGGAINLGYNDVYKIKSSTKAMMQKVQQGFKASRLGQSANGFKLTKTPEEINQLKKIKERIRKDHLAEDQKIDLGDQKITDYKKNFIVDDKMREICQNKDMKFNQRKNDLKWYAQTYIKTKDSLRGR